MSKWERAWAEKVQAELAVLLKLFLDADKWIKYEGEDYFAVILCHV